MKKKTIKKTTKNTTKKELKNKAEKEQLKKKELATTLYLDRVNKELQQRFQVEHVKYIVNNGIVVKGWMIADKKGIPETIKLLQMQKAPIYILGDLASAVIGWDIVRDMIVGSLWKNEEKVDQIETKDMNKIKKKLVEWYKKTRSKQ